MAVCDLKPAVSRGLAIVLATAAFAAPGHGQPCNPAIDGTYCASQMPATPQRSTSPVTRSEGLGALLTAPQGSDAPGMLGAITFNSDGSRCMGLLRRVGCS